MKRHSGLILTLLTLALGGADAAPLRDIRPGQATFHPESFTFEMRSAGGTVFFYMADERFGGELWKLDASGRGVLLKDIVPGHTGSFPNSFTDVNGTLFFQTITSPMGGLWKSDGTQAGTVQVLRMRPGARIRHADMAALGGTLFFGYSADQSDEELWKSDGTEAGTVLVKDIRPGPEGAEVRGLKSLGGVLYFLADDGVHGTELWKSDGTGAGTVLVKDIRPGSEGLSHPNKSSDLIPMAGVGGTLFFLTAGNAGTVELWKSNGTEAGTLRVKTLTGSTSAAFWELELAEVRGTLFLAVNDELWKSDGTEAGTVLLRDFSTGGYDGPQMLTATNSALFFVSGWSLWKSDGTPTGTVSIKDFSSSSRGISERILRAAGDTAFLAVRLYSGSGAWTDRMELWKSDGTEAGTALVRSFPSGTAPVEVWNVGEVLFFGTRAYENSSGIQGLWRSDGTEAGTVQVEHAVPVFQGSSMRNPTRVGDLTFFTADNGSHGQELWKSDGTEAGTVMVKDIRPGARGSEPGDLRVLGGLLFFIADDGTHGPELWKSDGTEAGTVMVKDILTSSSSYLRPGGLVVMGGMLFLSADDGTHGQELWKSDGTETGTVMVKDIRPGPGRSGARNLTVVRGQLFFSADDGIHGAELWKSDGTEAGTVMVKDLVPGSSGNEPEEFTPTPETLFFTNGSRELWRTDGTEAGTVMLKSLSLVVYPRAVGNTLYFIGADAEHGAELWKSDGTEAGTVMVKDLNPGPDHSYPHAFTPVGDRVVFMAYEPEHGFEPWVTDGSSQGTFLLKDVLPGPGDAVSLDSEMTTVLSLEDRGLALFTATDGLHGLELWMTDGTPEGTVQVVDLLPGEGSSEPGNFLRMGEQLFFSAMDAQAGNEPHLLALPVARSRTVPLVTCPADVTQESLEANGTRVEYPPASASDTEGPPQLDYSTPSGSLFPVGATTVTVTATDASGNRGQCSFQVHVSPPAQGCGCSATETPGAAFLWLLLALLVLVTRR
jgi:MYXO-CTERM domain-containing protein